MRHFFHLFVLGAILWLLLPGCISKSMMDDMQPGECDTTEVSFSSDIHPILQSNCTGCHNNTVANGGVNLATFAGVSQVALNGRLLGSVSHAPGFVPMPQAGSQIPACDKDRIEAWINQGAQNN